MCYQLIDKWHPRCFTNPPISTFYLIPWYVITIPPIWQLRVWCTHLDLMLKCFSLPFISSWVVGNQDNLVPNTVGKQLVKSSTMPIGISSECLQFVRVLPLQLTGLRSVAIFHNLYPHSTMTPCHLRLSAPGLSTPVPPQHHSTKHFNSCEPNLWDLTVAIVMLKVWLQWVGCGIQEENTQGSLVIIINLYSFYSLIYTHFHYPISSGKFWISKLAKTDGKDAQRLKRWSLERQ